jgi:hypothetical protein
MKKFAIIFVGLVGVLLVIGVVLFWPVRAVPPPASRVSTSYDPAKNVTTIKKDGFTWDLAGNAVTNIGTITNPTPLKSASP